MIEIIGARGNEDDQTVFFKIMIDSDVYEWHADIPKDADPQAHLEAMKDKIHFLILGKMYREADWQRFKTEKNTDTEAFEEWVKKGHKNKVVIGQTKKGKPKYGYEIIEKQKWKSTHPKHITMIKKIEASSVDKQTKDLLKEMVKD